MTLKNIRKNKHLKQKQIGELLGISQEAVSHYETKNRIPSLKTAKHLADILGIDLNTIYYCFYPETQTKNISA